MKRFAFILAALALALVAPRPAEAHGYASFRTYAVAVPFVPTYQVTFAVPVYAAPVAVAAPACAPAAVAPVAVQAAPVCAAPTVEAAPAYSAFAAVAPYVSGFGYASTFANASYFNFVRERFFGTRVRVRTRGVAVAVGVPRRQVVRQRTVTRRR